jgi:hypothetical protein
MQLNILGIIIANIAFNGFLTLVEITDFIKGIQQTTWLIKE